MLVGEGQLPQCLVDKEWVLPLKQFLRVLRLHLQHRVRFWWSCREWLQATLVTLHEYNILIVFSIYESRQLIFVIFIVINTVMSR